MTTTKTQSITTRAMLISLSISYWTGKAGDERMIDAIVNEHHNERDTADAKKILIHPDALNAPKAVRSRARAYFFKRTSPWLDGGTRVMASDFYQDMSEKLREFQSEYEQVVNDRIIKPYSSLKGEARKRLGDLYRDEDYPTVEQLRRKFEWTVKVLPVPEAGDWRVDLGAKDNAQIKKQIDEQVKAACDLITRDLWVRLHEVVSKMAEKLKDADGTFRDSLVDNIKELCAILPQMNVAGDPKLEAMTKEVAKKLTAIPAATLREDNKARKQAKSAADDLLARMAGYIGK